MVLYADYISIKKLFSIHTPTYTQIIFSIGEKLFPNRELPQACSDWLNQGNKCADLWQPLIFNQNSKVICSFTKYFHRRFVWQSLSYKVFFFVLGRAWWATHKWGNGFISTCKTWQKRKITSLCEVYNVLILVCCQ